MDYYTSLGDSLAIGLPLAALDGGVFTVVYLCMKIFVLTLAKFGMLLRHITYFGLTHFS